MTSDSAPLPELSQSERTRYSRHIILPEIGFDGQRRLKNGRVLIVGAGGLGSPVALYLAAAGIGTIGIVDYDHIELSNLQRQILHSTSQVGQLKTRSARERLTEVNPEVAVVLHEVRISPENIVPILAGYDVVVDATDNFSTRYLINDACVLSKKPNVYGAIYRFEGQASVFSPLSGPCYRCLFPDPPPPEAVPNCAEGGVLGVLAGFIGVIQATEVIKILLGLGNTLSGRLLMYDASDMRVDILKISRQADCPICGQHPKITSVAESVLSCQTAEAASAGLSSSSSSSSSSSPAASAAVKELTALELSQKLKAKEEILLLDVRNPEEHKLCHIQGCMLIPLKELQSRLDELDTQKEILVYCKSGGRSGNAAKILTDSGFLHVSNLKGGILSWIKDVDPKMQSY